VAFCLDDFTDGLFIAGQLLNAAVVTAKKQGRLKSALLIIYLYWYLARLFASGASPRSRGSTRCARSPQPQALGRILSNITRV
jgi:hypothetical protein